MTYTPRSEQLGGLPIEEASCFGMPHIAKGAECAIVDGHLAFDSWQDRDGQKRSKVKIVVDDPINGLMLKPRDGGQGSYTPRDAAPRGGYGSQQGGYAEEQPPLSVYDADIPF